MTTTIADPAGFVPFAALGVSLAPAQAANEPFGPPATAQQDPLSPMLASSAAVGWDPYEIWAKRVRDPRAAKEGTPR